MHKQISQPGNKCTSKGKHNKYQATSSTIRQDRQTDGLLLVVVRVVVLHAVSNNRKKLREYIQTAAAAVTAAAQVSECVF